MQNILANAERFNKNAKILRQEHGFINRLLQHIENRPDKIQTFTTLATMINMLTVFKFFNTAQYIKPANPIVDKLSKENILSYLSTTFTSLDNTDINYIYKICSQDANPAKSSLYVELKLSKTAEVLYTKISNYLNEKQLNLVSPPANEQNGTSSLPKLDEIISLQDWQNFFNKDVNTKNYEKCEQITTEIYTLTEKIGVKQENVSKNINESLKNFLTCLILFKLENSNLAKYLDSNKLKDKLHVYAAVIRYLISTGLTFEEAYTNISNVFDTFNLNRYKYQLNKQKFKELKQEFSNEKDYLEEQVRAMPTLKAVIPLQALVEMDIIETFIRGVISPNDTKIIECSILFLQLNLINEEIANDLLKNLEVLKAWIDKTADLEEKTARRNAANSVIACYLLNIRHPGSGISLQLTNLNLNEVPPIDKLTGLEHISNINLENNEIRTLPAGIFSGFTNLISVWLKNNPIANIPIAAFNPKTQKIIQVLGQESSSMIQITKDKIYASYLCSDSLDDLAFIEEHYLSELLLNKGKLADQSLRLKIIEKLLYRIAAGKVNLNQFDLGIDFWADYFKEYQVPLSKLIIPNLDYFLQKAGKEKILSVIGDNQFYLQSNEAYLSYLSMLRINNFTERVVKLVADNYSLDLDSSSNTSVNPQNLKTNIKELLKELAEIKRKGTYWQMEKSFLTEKIEDILLNEEISLNVATEIQINLYEALKKYSSDKISFIIFEISYRIREQFQNNSYSFQDLVFNYINHVLIRTIKNQILVTKIKEKAADLANKINKIINKELLHEFETEYYMDIMEKYIPKIKNISPEKKGLFINEIKEYQAKVDIYTLSEKVFADLNQLAEGENSLKLAHPEIFYAYLISMLPHLEPEQIAQFMEINLDMPENIRQILINYSEE